MAILDRPMFQRPLTKDELRAYGIPAFANGGVVQKFKIGGYTGYGFGQGEQGQSLYERLADPKNYMEKDKEPKTAISDVLNNYEDKIIRDQKNPPSVLTEKSTETVTPDSTTETETVTEKQTSKENGKEKPKVSDERLLFDRAKKKSETYREFLKKYGEDDFRTQSFLQLAQFGLNLMSQAGSNFLDKVAKSAQDPLKAFAEIASKNTQYQKELDFLALQKSEEEIAKEQEQAFDLQIAMLKEEDKTQIQKIADGLVGKKNPNTGEIYTVETAYDQAMKNYLFEKTPLREEYVKDRYTFYRDQDETVEEATRLAEEDANAMYGSAKQDIPVLTKQEDWPTIAVGSKFKIKDKTYEKTGPNPTDFREVE